MSSSKSSNSEALNVGSESPNTSAFVIDPSQVRYIKLGRGGMWEEECIQKGIARFGFGSANAERFPICVAGDWDGLVASFLADGRSQGTATRFSNETREFFTDEGTTLWISFSAGKLWWGCFTADKAERHEDGGGVFRRIRGGWRSTDRNGVELTVDRLSGKLTKVSAYRGTTCRVEASEYVVNRINGKRKPEVERAIETTNALRSNIQDLFTLLHERDFEILVELVFSTSGWRRLGVSGGTQKTIDLDLMLPSTKERAFVQVKSRTTRAEFNEYLHALQYMPQYQKMFFVFHSGDVTETSDDENGVVVVGPESLADMVIDAGLVTWLVEKVS